MQYQTISLFSGAMGLDIGLMQAGMHVAIGLDNNKWCAETIRNNGHKCAEMDIRSLLKVSPDATYLLAAANIQNPKDLFAIVGGPPCQPFSTAGKRLSTDDPRGTLFRDFLAVVAALRPRFLVMENVQGLVSASMVNDSGERVPGLVLETILREFHALGYATVHGVLNAVDYGTPQFRERLLIIGSRDHEPIFLPRPTHFQTHQSPRYRWRTLGDAITPLLGRQMLGTQFSALQQRFLRLVPPGGNWRDLPEHLQQEALGGAYKSGGGKVGFYRVLDMEQPCPTLVTSPTQRATMLCHPCEVRPLSVLEYARIQGFPAEWEFAGGVAQQYRQIGNAVPIALGVAIGEMLCAVATRTAQVRSKRRFSSPQRTGTEIFTQP